jgi:type I restriction enzyme R subunit
MNKKTLTEEDIKFRYITPAIEKAGWLKKQIKMEQSFTDGRVILHGNKTLRGKKKRADYILYYKSNFPLAVVEAKDNNKASGIGLEQAEGYGKILDIPYVYSSNGDGFVEQNLITGEINNTLTLNDFPSPETLYKRYLLDMQIPQDKENMILQPYFYEHGGKVPRYYQRNAINRTIDAVAHGKDRILLVCATGTGKTFMAFQIVYRLMQSGAKKRVLYLADRNVLIDQTMTGDFKSFNNRMVKVQNRKLDSSYELYFSLYQQVSGEDNEETFRQFKPEFFDLIIVDECHRGSPREDSQWRKVLEYFSRATQIGCTATPVQTKVASNTTYFGEPIYEYSLKQGIDDGFLAPYKVLRINIDVDVEGYRPEKGKLDAEGNEIEDRLYNVKDYDRTLVISSRTTLVAQKITELLRKTDPMSKTIVFCVDIEHAERMRQALVKENQDLYAEDNRYIMRITGDNQEGKDQIENFIDEESPYPVIAVTSKLLSTGVDAKMCKLIVLDSNINSMIEFKQIIGRGTRLLYDKGKTHFTIMDFRNVTRHFADERFDGPAEVIIEQDGEDPIDVVELDGNGVSLDGDDPETKQGPDDEFVKPINPIELLDDDLPIGELKPKKYYVNDIEVSVLSERVQYYDGNGSLITENLIDYTKKNILGQYAELSDFLNKWKASDKKKVILEELKDSGIWLDAIRDEKPNFKDVDDFDLICHLAYDKKPLTKQERANDVKKRDYLNKYEGKAREVLEILLDKYTNEGLKDIENPRILQLSEFSKLGGPVGVIHSFGGKSFYMDAIKDFENAIYAIV